MNLRKELKCACISLSLKSATKQGIIEEIIDMMVQAGKLNDKEAAVACVLERERRMSTGMQFGVAIPHGKTSAVDTLITAVALKKEGVDFGSLDGEPSTIFVMTVSPVNRTGPHIRFLAEISKLLNYDSVRERLLDAETAEDIIEILTEDEE